MTLQLRPTFSESWYRVKTLKVRLRPSAQISRQYYRGERLIGVGLIDILPDGLSSVYFYHAPEWRPQAPGVFSLMCEFDFCRERGIPYLYLGYWIERCPSMAYKSGYGPHEVLENYVEEDESPEWG